MNLVLHLTSQDCFSLFLTLFFFFLPQSRDRLVRALRAMSAGDAADQVIRQVDKMIKNAERALREARLGKVIVGKWQLYPKITSCYFLSP